MSPSNHTVILDHERINLIIERLAHEIYEKHHDREQLTLIGIKDRGYDIAKRINKHLLTISSQPITLESIGLDKASPTQHAVDMSIEGTKLEGATIILVDDVLNSGKTLVHALKALLDYNPRSITTAVLVDRIHRDYPVRADMVGMTLSTTIEERVEVAIGKRDYAYLV